MPDWLQSEDITRTIEIWGAVISSVIALATVVQVLVTWAIARSISRASTITESLAQARSIDSPWQEFNRLVVVDSEFRNTLRLMEGLSEPEDITQLRYVLFYILNVINSAWLAARATKDGFNHARTVIHDHVRILYIQRDLVLDILRSSRGYSSEFVSDIEQAFQRLDSEKRKDDD